MHRYLIQRPLPGAGELSDDQLRAISARSNEVLRELGPDIQWLHSYVTADRITCVYLAKDESMVREHARRGGFPCETVSAVRTTLDPLRGT